MCFSARASFAASGITAIAGVVSMTSAKHSPHRWLAVVPIFFAIQQLAEGIQWGVLEGARGGALQAPAMYLFLGVANVLWPIWVPGAIRAGEPDPRRRRWLTGLLGLGIVESMVELWALAGHPVTASAASGHIAYQIGTSGPVWAIAAVVYPIVVAGPPLLSSNPLLRLVGVGVLCSLVVVRLAYLESTASVWCFFAAIISGLIAWVVRRDAIRRDSRPAALAR